MGNPPQIDTSVHYVSRRIMFALARERFESAAARLAQSDGKIDPDMLDADEMMLEPHGPPAA